MKEITVLKPIAVPDCCYCYDKDNGFCCGAFSKKSGCFWGYSPIKISEDLYEKDSRCKELLFEENIR